MLKRKHLLAAFSALIIFAFFSCNNKGKDEERYSSPPGYNLAEGTQIKLPPELDEISGVFYYGKDSSVFCINDEKGFLYKVFLNPDIALQKWKFTKHGDFEDLLLLDSNFYVLQSSGNLLKFKFFSGDSLNLDTIHIPIEGTNEFEILYYNNASKEMVLICKDCQIDNKKQVSAFAFNPVNNQSRAAFVLQTKEIESKLKERGKFKASAAGINPVTNQLFIVSSVNKALVICDTEGKVQEVYNLNPKVFKQPEGLTFTAEGDLIISNESADKGAANILFFKYKK